MGLVFVACSDAPAVTTRTSAPIENTLLAASTTTTEVVFDPGDLTSFGPVEIDLGGTRHQVAIADTEAERGQGMRGIGDVGDFLGMLFVWDEEVSTGFFMKDTRMPLDLYFYDSGGELVDQTSLVPCSEDPCPAYVSDALFQWVLETPAGNLAPPLGPLSLVSK